MKWLLYFRLCKLFQDIHKSTFWKAMGLFCAKVNNILSGQPRYIGIGSRPHTDMDESHSGWLIYMPCQVLLMTDSNTNGQYWQMFVHWYVCTKLGPHNKFDQSYINSILYLLLMGQMPCTCYCSEIVSYNQALVQKGRLHLVHDKSKVTSTLHVKNLKSDISQKIRFMA